MRSCPLMAAHYSSRRTREELRHHLTGRAALGQRPSRWTLSCLAVGSMAVESNCQRGGQGEEGVAAAWTLSNSPQSLRTPRALPGPEALRRPR